MRWFRIWSPFGLNLPKSADPSGVERVGENFKLKLRFPNPNYRKPQSPNPNYRKPQNPISKSYKNLKDPTSKIPKSKPHGPKDRMLKFHGPKNQNSSNSKPQWPTYLNVSLAQAKAHGTKIPSAKKSNKSKSIEWPVATTNGRGHWPGPGPKILEPWAKILNIRGCAWGKPAGSRRPLNPRFRGANSFLHGPSK